VREVLGFVESGDYHTHRHGRQDRVGDEVELLPGVVSDLDRGIVGT
jgi:hypothetical protein